MKTSRGRTALLGGLALVLVAGCSLTESGSSGDPSFPVPSVSFVEPSESAQPSVPPQPPADAEIGGTWDGTWVIDGYGNTGDFTMELVQSGSAFSGQIESTNTDCPTGTVDGTVEGSDVTFGWVLSGVTVSFTGTREGDSMSGTWSSIACSDANISLTGTWEATKRP
jgi:hypothetical protein